jgi:hypothetical protein
MEMVIGIEMFLHSLIPIEIRRAVGYVFSCSV